MISPFDIAESARIDGNDVIYAFWMMDMLIDKEFHYDKRGDTI